jgi:hypothetical protein
MSDDHSSDSLGALVREVFDLVVAYAKQETVDPIKALGRFVVFGLAGSAAVATGLVLLGIALLRALQTETGTVFRGRLTWVPYLVVAGAAIVVLGIAAQRILKGRPR